MSEAALNKSLDDLIKEQRKKKPQRKPVKGAKPGRANQPKQGAPKVVSVVKGGLAKRRGSAPGGKTRPASRPGPGSRLGGGLSRPASQQKENHRAPSVDGTKLYVANLHFNVSDADIKELFETIGPLVSYKIHRKGDRTSRGSGEAVFRKRADAERAMNKYNNVQLDGRPMRIELIERVQTTSGQGARTLKSGIKLGGNGGRGGASRNGGGRGRGRGGPNRRRGGGGGNRAVAMQE